MRSSTMPNLPGNKSSREHGTRYTRISTAPAQALQHLNYSIKSLWLSCLSFSMIPRTLVQVLTTSDTKATIALCVSLQCRAQPKILLQVHAVGNTSKVATSVVNIDLQRLKTAQPELISRESSQVVCAMLKLPFQGYCVQMSEQAVHKMRLSLAEVAVQHLIY